LSVGDRRRRAGKRCAEEREGEAKRAEGAAHRAAVYST
jgi:hypothetical protein